MLQTFRNPRFASPASPGGMPQPGASLRRQIIVLLSLIMLPALAFSVIWTAIHGHQLQSARINSANRTGMVIANEFDAFLRVGQSTVQTVFNSDRAGALDSGKCSSQLRQILSENVQFSYAAVFADGQFNCMANRPDAQGDIETQVAGQAIDDASIMDLFSQLSVPGVSVVRDADGKNLVFGLRLDNQGLLVLLAAPVDVVSQLFKKVFVLDRGTALMSADGNLLLSTVTSTLPRQWLPPAETLQSFLTSGEPHMEADSISGEDFLYFSTASETLGLRIITGYQKRLFFEQERTAFQIALFPPLIMLLAAAGGAMWAVERKVLRWVYYLQRVARVYGSGRFSVRAVRMGKAPRELAELGNTFNRMADNIASHARQQEEAASEKAGLLRELHHRVKNNFQVIVSLFNLRKRNSRQADSAGNSEDSRFIEEHVQAMAIAYRVGYSSSDLGNAPLAELLHDTVDALRRVCGIDVDDVIEEPPLTGSVVNLDRAIGITLYLSACLPAYFDLLRSGQVAKVSISADLSSGSLCLSIDTVPSVPVLLDSLREKLARAYLRQLDASALPTQTPGERSISIPLDESQEEQPQKRSAS